MFLSLYKKRIHNILRGIPPTYGYQILRYPNNSFLFVLELLGLQLVNFLLVLSWGLGG